MRKSPLNISVEKDTRKKLADLAKKNRRSLSGEIAALVDEAWTRIAQGAGHRASESFKRPDSQLSGFELAA